MQSTNHSISKFFIRFNRSKGQPGRGSEDHSWRVFENDQEYICKHIKINVPCFDEQTGPDHNICCHGYKQINNETSTITINGEP